MRPHFCRVFDIVLWNPFCFSYVTVNLHSTTYIPTFKNVNIILIIISLPVQPVRLLLENQEI